MVHQFFDKKQINKRQISFINQSLESLKNAKSIRLKAIFGALILLKKEVISE